MASPAGEGERNVQQVLKPQPQRLPPRKLACVTRARSEDGRREPEEGGGALRSGGQAEAGGHFCHAGLLRELWGQLSPGRRHRAAGGDRHAAAGGAHQAP